MQVLKVGDAITLVFSTVMDEFTRGLVDEDEDAEAAPTDRGYWESRATKEMLTYVSDLLTLFKNFGPGLELNYNKFYIRIYREGRPINFVTFRPRTNYIILALKLKESDEINQQIENAGLEALDYNKKWGNYRLRLTKGDIKNKADVIEELAKLAYQIRIG
jgi:hypothetical protein